MAFQMEKCHTFGQLLLYQTSDVVDAGINAGLRLVDASGEVVDEFLARTGRSYPLLSFV